ncbi:MAG: 2-hydroxyacyl-CoA dehydratase family protein [Dehalococcoidia bacterium]|nr:2-hydroxyacyl-CoA dehydratase family protein [Dehalococcoidia bacterium]
MTLTEKRSRLDRMVRTCRMIQRMSRVRPDTYKSEVYYYELMATYYDRLRKAEEEGKFIAAHTVFFPVEILYAMDIVPMHTEASTIAMGLLLGEQPSLLSAAAELRLAPEICSAHRALAGAFSLKFMPRPSVMLWSNLICDNTAKSGELLAELSNNCPKFFLDHPFTGTPEEEKYLIEELKDLISFLEVQTGRKMNWDKLAESVARMDHHIQLYREICELRKAVPSPFYSRGYLEILLADYWYAGQPEATSYLELLRDELAGMVRAGKGAVEPERFRLMSLFVPPINLTGLLEEVFKKHGAVSVVEPFFTFWREGRLDPSKPLESIARKLYMIPERRTMYGPLGDGTIREIVELAREYKVDGAIYYAYMGCRHTCATIKVFKDVLSEIDVPVLTLDNDLIDPTLNNENEIQQKLEQFFELLEDR